MSRLPFYCGKICWVLLFFLVICSETLAQADTNNKKVSAIRCNQKIHIDGVLDEPAWNQAPFASGFTELEPIPGKTARFDSEIRVMYDDFSLYISAVLFDPAQDSILKELSPRDQIGNTDWFVIQIDPYNTGQLAFEFLLTASGVQVERKVQSPNRRDVTWDAVWMSHVRITDQGWIAEIEIPYSALRFPSGSNKDWSINFGRYVRRFREEAWWNAINPAISNRLHQSGRLTDVRDIKPPPRIIATPFFGAYLSHKPGRDNTPWRHRFTGGMDTKIGLSDAFTLDATLIPDFGQVRFDDLVLNLSPFEIQLQENRPFFTEGTELFNRGGIFYSRRIGDRPFYLRQSDWRLQAGLQDQSLPQASPLINASKLSGRLQNGLGIGVFNAVENRLYINQNDPEGQEDKLLINPLTNYNLTVLDQILPNNSFVSLTNANVMREGTAYDANVLATEFALRNKANSWLFSGKGAWSRKFGESVLSNGHTFGAGLEKTKGNWQYRVHYEELSPTYDPNDLGFLPRNNERLAYANLSYNLFSPRGFLNYANASVRMDYKRLYRPDVFTRFTTSLNSFFMTRDFFAFSGYAVLEPLAGYDYFDPRTRDFSQFFKIPANYLLGGFISTDYRKPFAYDINSNIQWFDEKGRVSWFLRVAPRVRVNDHLFFVYSTEYRKLWRDVGFTSRNNSSVGASALSPESVLYATRDQEIIINSISARYNFNPLNSLLLTTRHYWTGVRARQFGVLGREGQLLSTPYTGLDPEGNDLHSLNLTLFNIDLVYTWRFAPGSDLVIVWKNTINTFQSGNARSFWEALNTLPGQIQENSLSLRMIYYLDYALVNRRWSEIKAKKSHG